MVELLEMSWEAQACLLYTVLLKESRVLFETPPLINSALGMRLWQPNEQSKNVGYIIHKGFDYPKEIDDQINRLNISLVTKLHADKHTTRGLNTFGENDHRDFEYIHPIIRATTDDFPDDWIRSVEILHLICSPERAIEIIDQWNQRQVDLNAFGKTKFLWEPLPWACLPEVSGACYTCKSMRLTISHNDRTWIASMKQLKE